MALTDLPGDLPVPENDGAADHLAGTGLPNVVLTGTNGTVGLGALPGTAVLYCYPMTGTPGVALPRDWDEIPGARGCTPQSCGFRDHLTELTAAGARHVHGISAQAPDELAEARERLGLPYALLSDAEGALAGALRLPTFEADGRTLLKRLTMIVRDGTIVKVFYPTFSHGCAPTPPERRLGPGGSRPRVHRPRARGSGRVDPLANARDDAVEHRLGQDAGIRVVARAVVARVDAQATDPVLRAMGEGMRRDPRAESAERGVVADPAQTQQIG